MKQSNKLILVGGVIYFVVTLFTFLLLIFFPDVDNNQMLFLFTNLLGGATLLIFIGCFDLKIVREIKS